MVKVFWLYFLHIQDVKVPHHKERSLQVHGFLITPYSSLTAKSMSALGGMYTTMMITAENFLGSQNSWHMTINYSTSGKQKDFKVCTLLLSHQELLIMRRSPPPLLLSVRSCTLSAWCMEKPGSSMAESSTVSDSQVSVRQITQQSHISRCYDIRARSSHSFFSRDHTLANSMLGSGGQLAHHLTLASTLAHSPLLPQQHLRGSWSG